MPEKPANAIAMIAAVTSVIGKPLKHLGISALSVFSRTPASRQMASRNHIPVATDAAKTMPKLSYDENTMVLFAVPRMAQFVVMRGR